jgi:hypothetical protein
MAKTKPPKINRAQSRPEYRLLIEPFADPLSKRTGVLFLFRTTEEFENFVYELVVQTTIKGKKIFFKIAGLKPPLTGFPAAGPALCRCEFDNLEFGYYTLVVDRRGRQINQFRISVHKEISILQAANEGKFIDVTTDRNEWSSNLEGEDA